VYHKYYYYYRTHDTIATTDVNCTGYDFGRRPPRLVQWWWRWLRRSWWTRQGACPRFCESAPAAAEASGSAVRCCSFCSFSYLRFSYRLGQRRWRWARPIVGDLRDLEALSSETATNGYRTTRSSKTIALNHRFLSRPSNPYSTMRLPYTVELLLYNIYIIFRTSNVFPAYHINITYMVSV